jgi:hypothetical protein
MPAEFIAMMNPPAARWLADHFVACAKDFEACRRYNAEHPELLRKRLARPESIAALIAARELFK